MRAVLVDWLIQVHLKFHFLPETLYLCVQILDTYLQVSKHDMARLFGITAKWHPDQGPVGLQSTSRPPPRIS
jgi:hypothetical protein